MALSFRDARNVVLSEIGKITGTAAPEIVPLDEADGRVLVRAVRADRDQPPFDRVTRDGFAVRSGDVAGASGSPVTLAVVGEAPPGKVYPGEVGAGQCVEIMTGSPRPSGADAVVMVEHTERTEEGAAWVLIKRPVAAGENVVARGSEARAGDTALPAGKRLDAAAIGLLASVGCARPVVGARPRVALVSTGDELVPVDQVPGIAQIRNSNLHSLAAQVAAAGAVPVAMPIGRDDPVALRGLLGEALERADVLVLSGGVSMGKYDFVEGVLSELGARIVFDSVEIRPGRPLVFGFVRDKPFFGLPGNPLSTLVTFRLFVEPALHLLAGGTARPFTCLGARLGADYAQRKLPLTVFVPARLEAAAPGDVDVTRVTPRPSQGSGDLMAMAEADCLIMLEPGLTTLSAGDWVPVVPK